MNSLSVSRIHYEFAIYFANLAWINLAISNTYSDNIMTFTGINQPVERWTVVKNNIWYTKWITIANSYWNEWKSHISNEFTMVNVFHSRITTWLLFQPWLKLFFSESWQSIKWYNINRLYHKMPTGWRYMDFINLFVRISPIEIHAISNPISWPRINFFSESDAVGLKVLETLVSRLIWPFLFK